MDARSEPPGFPINRYERRLFRVIHVYPRLLGANAKLTAR